MWGGKQAKRQTNQEAKQREQNSKGAKKPDTNALTLLVGQQK